MHITEYTTDIMEIISSIQMEHEVIDIEKKGDDIKN